MLKRAENLKNLQAPVRNLVKVLGDLYLKETGVPLVVVEGYRSPERQDRLYAQGRTAPGTIVTWVKGLFSAHNYGLAVDVAPEAVLSKPGWDPENPLWEALGRLAKRVGFTWGGDWKTPDKPHLEFHPGLSLAEIRDHFLKTGEVLLSKVLRPEVLLVVVFGVWAFLRYARGRLS